jgi:catechol 2,3-dioxygenase-like lactoylglutathione lyase family enzyme
MDESVRFYTEVLGMELTGRGRIEATRGEWAQLKSEGVAHLLEPNWYAPDSPFFEEFRSGSEIDHLCFHTDDLDAALKGFTEKGVAVVAGPYVADGWKLVYVSDRNGIWIELGERVSEGIPR